jgi:hypothetical protein
MRMRVSCACGLGMGPSPCPWHTPLPPSLQCRWVVPPTLLVAPQQRSPWKRSSTTKTPRADWYCCSSLENH